MLLSGIGGTSAGWYTSEVGLATRRTDRYATDPWRHGVLASGQAVLPVVGQASQRSRYSIKSFSGVKIQAMSRPLKAAAGFGGRMRTALRLLAWAIASATLSTS